MATYRYRYTLEPYKGMKTRYHCPNGCKGKTFVRYIDIETGIHLPIKFGKCERLNKCGYHLNPYTSGYAKMTWLQEQNNESWKSINITPPRITKSNQTKQQRSYIPLNIFKSSLRNYQDNCFVQFLSRKFGPEKTTELVQRFYIGTSKYWKGATVFWLVDEEKNIAGGQVISFNEHGNTKKETQADGSKKRFNSWVHTALLRDYRKQKKALPDWLDNYIKNSPKYPCLFGLTQLDIECSAKPIAVVESAKTAVIATAYLPQYIWMAVGSLSYLNKDRLMALKGRNITLFPDVGGYEKWNRELAKITDLTKITISDLLERKKGKQGSDIADYLLKYPISDFRESIVETSIHTSIDTWINQDGLTIKTPINNKGYPISWD